MTELSLEHQILSPYTAFVGVERDGPIQNNTLAKVRYVPIQLSKDSEYQSTPQAMSYGSYRGGPIGQMAPPMAYGFHRHGGMGAMPQAMAYNSYGGGSQAWML